MTHSYNNPKAYSENNSLQYEFAMKVIDDIKISPSAKVLDLGCGDGLITSKLAELAPNGHVIGTDISAQMIAHASKKYSGYRNLEFMQMDARKNIFENQFDLITSFNALHWVKDQKAALAGISRAAAPGAKIVLLLSHKKSLYHHILDKICSAKPWDKHFSDYVNPRSFFEKNNYENMLKQSGLTVTSITQEEMIYHFDSTEKLKAFFRSSMANIKHIPNDKKEKFLADFTLEYISALEKPNTDKIPLAFLCLIIQAIKNSCPIS
jgi:ubiquinone/menaquinone biosynthesis C-methylase UbiE